MPFTTMAVVFLYAEAGNTFVREKVRRNKAQLPEVVNVVPTKAPSEVACPSPRVALAGTPSVAV